MPSLNKRVASVKFEKVSGEFEKASGEFQARKSK